MRKNYQMRRAEAGLWESLEEDWQSRSKSSEMENRKKRLDLESELG
jgi:hypothetical protein